MAALTCQGLTAPAPPGDSGGTRREANALPTELLRGRVVSTGSYAHWRESRYQLAERFMKDPRAVMPAADMPPYDLPEEELDALARYLASLK
jgi:hypothetical protein